MDDLGRAMALVWLAVACCSAVVVLIVLTILSIFVPLQLWFVTALCLLIGAAFATARFMLG